MQILILGSHGVGKSTLAKDLVKGLLAENRGNPPYIIDGVSRTVKAQGYEINENGTGETQLEMFNRIMFECCRKRKASHVIHVSSIPRVWAYSCWIHQAANGTELSNQFMHMVRNVAGYQIAEMFDIVFWLPIEFDVEADGVRSVEGKFQKYIERAVRSLAVAYAQTGKIVPLTGDRQERVDASLEVVTRLVEERKKHLH